MLGIVLINYHSEDELTAFIKNELQHIKVPCKIVVVNNSYSESSQERLHKGFKTVGLAHLLDVSIFIITKNENLGYARANNFGAQFLKQKINPKYLLFSNTDIVLRDSNVVDELVAALQRLSNDVAVIGPRVLGLDGMDQSPHPKISFSRYLAWRLFPFLKGKIKLLKLKKGTKDKNNIAQEGYCYWVSGCFMLVKSKDFFKVNGFDENTFLYGEEKILAERLLKINKQMYYYPDVAILHEQGGTTNQNIISDTLNYYLLSSTHYYYQHYLKAPKFCLGVLKLFDKTSKPS